jgi:hypothetical protein
VSIARKEGWISLAEAEPRKAPPSLSVAEIGALGETDREAYNQARADWHANLGPLRTPDLGRIHDELWELLDANRQDPDRVRGAAAIDAYPGLGKTTAALSFAKAFHRREIALHGRATAEGHEHLPVARIGLTSNTTMRGFNQALCDFYGHPGAARGTAGQLASRALDCVLSCATSVIVIDDVHFLNVRRSAGLEVANHLKWLANEFPVTFVYAGVGLRERGLLSEGLSGAESGFAQIARRWTRMSMNPFTLSCEAGRGDWRALLLAIEARLVLARQDPGDVACELVEYLYARSGGHIGSLMSLITRGTYRAVRTGTERLTRELLEGITIDEAAEQARNALQAASTGAERGRNTRQADRRR